MWRSSEELVAQYSVDLRGFKGLKAKSVLGF
jgi:hypothetical protein